MILINVKWKVRPDAADLFPGKAKEYGDAVQKEPGNIFFEWAKSLNEENTYILIEAFADDAADAHVNSEHAQKFFAEAPDWVAETPQIINVQNVQQDGWGEMAEIQPR